jgi:hypothetical protein
MKNGPVYTSGLDQGCIWMEDCSTTGVSLTNSMETAVSQLKSAGFQIDVGTELVYRDSDGAWDGVRVTGLGPTIISFIGLGCNDRSSAISKLKSLR